MSLNTIHRVPEASRLDQGAATVSWQQAIFNSCCRLSRIRVRVSLLQSVCVCLRVLLRVTRAGLVLQGQRGHQEKDFKDQRYVPFLFLIDKYRLLPLWARRTANASVGFRVNRGHRGYRGLEDCLEKVFLELK